MGGAGRLPSIVSRLALRLGLVFAIQALVLGLLLFAAPRFVAALGDHILDVRRAALVELFEERGRGLAARSVLLATQAPDGKAALSQMASLPCDTGACWGLLLSRDGGALAASDGGVELPADLNRGVAKGLAERSDAGSPRWVSFYHQGVLYLAGGTPFPAASDGTWLVLAEDASGPLRRLALQVATAPEVWFEVDGGQGEYERPLTYSALMSGRLALAVSVPNAVGSDGIVANMIIPLPRLAQLLRAATLIFAASLFLLAGTLSLFFISAYVEVVRPYNARLKAIREYASSGIWQPPRTGYREHEAASSAITEAVRAQQRAEARAQHLLRELRAFVDNVPALATVKDAELKLRLVNVSLARAVGAPADSLVGKTDFDIFPEHLARIYREHDLETLQRKQALQFEEEVVVDGRRCLYRVVKAPILEPDGEPVGLVAVAIDVTEQKALEARLVEAQKMQVVGRLAGGLCHAFNNLLTTVIGSAELALAAMADDHPAWADVRQIRDTAEHGAALSRQLLVLGRQRLGRVEPVDFNELIQDLTPMLQETLGEGILLQVSRDPELPLVRGDAIQWRQAIVNLALNAREAMPSGGVFRLETLVCRAPWEAASLEPALQRDPVICITLQDTGLGLGKQAREHIFEPFYTTKGAAKGRGLGLPVVYSIVRQHNGAILYESEEGRGTAFMIYLPGLSADVSDEAKAQTQTAQAPTGEETVLLVEDDVMVRRLAERMLSAQGYTVWTADSAEEALSLLEVKGRVPELLLSDVIMPGLSGIELARRLHGRHDEMRVLLMSGYAGGNDEDVVEGFPLLWKPFTMRMLAQRVRLALDA